jgi:hypothetical protein
LLNEKKKAAAVEHGSPEHFPEIKTGKKKASTKAAKESKAPKAKGKASLPIHGDREVSEPAPKKQKKKKTLYAVPEVERKEVPKNKRKYTKKKVPGEKVKAKFASSTEKEIHAKVSAMPKRQQQKWAADNHEKFPSVAIHVGAKKLLRHLKKNTPHGKRFSALIDKKLAEQSVSVIRSILHEKLLAKS